MCLLPDVLLWDPLPDAVLVMSDEMCPEYDISHGERGKYFDRYWASLTGYRFLLVPCPWVVPVTTTNTMREVRDGHL